ncbi:MAG: AMP-binding protein [Opitutaceae bacterium]|nr:AMP-binding protein [Verrucomicrobiales bacterium]
MNLPSAFAESAATHAKKTALFWGDEEFTHEQVWFQTTWVANHLQQRFGLQPGQRVGLLMKNGPRFVPALFGSITGGGVVAPINSFLKAEEILQILADGEITLLITDAATSETLPALQKAHPNLRAFSIEDLPASLTAAIPVIDPKRTGDETAMLIYTSGTTGRPKGIMLSHLNLLANVESCRIMLRAVQEDRFIVLLPMFHSFMLTVGILLPILVGGSILIVKSVHPMKNVIEEIIHRQATMLPSVPAWFRPFIHAAPATGLPLRLCISGGAALPGEVLKEFNAKFTFPLLEGYGLSETSPVASFNPIQGPWKAGSIGLPIPNVEMSIQDDGGNLLPPGQTGEVCVRGKNVMQGYWNLPEETARVRRGDWLLTGDIGHRDEDGYYFITDRKKDMIIVNGINVYSREVEEVIYRYPGVREAAVVGQNDPRRGEHPVAFVAVMDGTHLDEKALLHHIREHLADYKVPRKISVVPALPRNATGKVLKTHLRDIANGSH